MILVVHHFHVVIIVNVLVVNHHVVEAVNEKLFVVAIMIVKFHPIIDHNNVDHHLVIANNDDQLVDIDHHRIEVELDRLRRKIIIHQVIEGKTNQREKIWF